MPRAMSKRAQLVPGQERSVTVVVKSLRNPPLDVTLSSQTPNTSVLDVKMAVAEQARIPVDKMKMLHKKKPVADSKVLKDFLAGGNGTAVEFSVMVMGGAAAIKTDESQDKGGAVQEGIAGKAVVDTKAFWADLQGFLVRRVGNEKLADELLGLFSEAWEKKS